MLHNYPVRLCSLINEKQENSMGQGIYVIVFVLTVSLHLQDFIGVPAVVDLGAIGDAITHLGGDPDKINPLVSQNYDHVTWSSNLGTDFLHTGCWSVVWHYLNPCLSRFCMHLIAKGEQSLVSIESIKCTESTFIMKIMTFAVYFMHHGYLLSSISVQC
jgi:hypothetical protein